MDLILWQTVEEFLSKDISCVVTNKKDVDMRCSPRSNSTPSPILSIPSPFPGNTKRYRTDRGRDFVQKDTKFIF